VVWVDAGNFAAIESEAAKVRNQGMIDAMNRMGYAAVMVGERELNDGLDAFQQMSKAARFPFVSANVVFEDDHTPVAQPYVVDTVRHGGRRVRVGFLGLNRYNTAFVKGTREGRNIVISSPFEAAKKLVPEMRPQVDILAVLTSLSISQARQLAQDVPGIDLIIGANGGVLSTDGDASAGAAIVYPGNQGKYLSEIRIALSEKGDKPATMTRRQHYLNKDYPIDAPMQQMVDAILGRENDLNRQLAAVPPPAGPQVAPAAGPHYVGTETCGGCHAEALTVWKRSGHARAFATLVQKNQDFSPDCVGCHVVGFGRKGGFVNARATPALLDVQCEACHGPGSAHAETPARGYGAAGARSCLGCHTQENSPEFDYFKYWPRIKH
jgi:cytochrome c554/c'-like protein